MRLLSIIFLAIFQASTKAFVLHDGFKSRTNSVSTTSSEKDVFDAEEAAVFDACNAPDPGVEAAMSERAVMLANKMMEEKLLYQSKPSLTEETDLCAIKNQPHQVSSDRALSKAFKMAYDLMAKKRTELKEKPRRKDNIEKEQILMKKATATVVKVLKSYREDPSQFKKDFATKGKDESALAIEVLERIISDTAEEILKVEREENEVITSFFDALHQEEMAEASLARAKARENAASNRISAIEDFADEYEIDERKRDMSIIHVNEEEEKFERREKSYAVRQEKESLIQEFDMNKHLADLREKEEVLKADLREIQDIVRDQLRAEWLQKEKENK